MGDIGIEGLRDRVEQLSNTLSNTERRQGLSALVKSAASQLKPQVADWIGILPQKLDDHIGSISLNPHPVINGRTYPVPNTQRFNIEIYEGLMVFFHKIFKLFITRMGVMDEEGVGIEHPILPFEQIANTTVSLMNAFWDGTHSDADSVPIHSLTDSQIFMEGLLLFGAERFVVAHEFGHIISHFRPDLYEVRIAGEVAKQALKQAPGMSSAKVEANWTAEFAADLIGVQLTINAETHDELRFIAHTAVEEVLAMFRMLEAFKEKTRQSRIFEETHPPAWMRAASVRAAAQRENPPEVFQLADAFNAIVSDILSTVR